VNQFAIVQQPGESQQVGADADIRREGESYDSEMAEQHGVNRKDAAV